MTTVVALNLAAVLFVGCKADITADDSTVINAIESQDWPKCSELPRKTIYDAYFEGEMFAERLILAGRVSSVIEELEHSRDNFKKTGDLVEILPLLLFYEMRESLDFAMKPRLTHKTEFLTIAVNTFDAYKANRDAYERREPDSVDRQWSAYFKAAEKAQIEGTGSWTPDAGVDVLLDGVNAHVLYDLPRAIREVVKNSESDIDELTEDFFAADSVYPIAEAAAKRDILTRFDSAVDIENIQKLFGNGGEYVKFSRSKAWEMGVGDGPLALIEEQPHFPHDPSSRKYFPKDLIERGICR